MPSLTPQQQLQLMRLVAQRARMSPANDAVRNFGMGQVRNIGSRFAQDLFRNQASQYGSTLLPDSMRGLGSQIGSTMGQIAPFLPYLQAIRAREPGTAAMNAVSHAASQAAAQAAGAAGASAGASAGMPSFMGFNPAMAVFAIGQLADAHDARKEAQRISRDLGRWGQDQEATGGEYAMPWIHLDRIANPGNSELMRQVEQIYGQFTPEEMAAVAGRDTADAMRARTAMDENPWRGDQQGLDSDMQSRFKEMLRLELYNQYLNAFREGKTDVYGNPVEGSGFSYQRPQAARYTGNQPFGNAPVNPYTGSPMGTPAPNVYAGGWYNPTYADPSSPLGGGADNQYYSYRRGTSPMAATPADLEARAREAANRAALGNTAPVMSSPGVGGNAMPQPQQGGTQPIQPVQPTEAFGRSPGGRNDYRFSMESEETPWYIGGQGA